MIFVLFYVVVSAAFFVWVLNGARFKRLHSKTINRHPEMAEVRQTDPLLVVRFDGPPREIDSGKRPDLGFAEFLSDNGSDRWDRDSE
jgi:hypothetical protein